MEHEGQTTQAYISRNSGSEAEDTEEEEEGGRRGGGGGGHIKTKKTKKKEQINEEILPTWLLSTTHSPRQTPDTTTTKDKPH